MKPTFSIRGLLISICVLSVCLMAILHPNLYWITIIQAVSGALMACLIAVSIGSNGRLRVQAIAFVVLTGLSLYQFQKAGSPFTNGIDFVTSAVEAITNSGTPKKSPKGEEVFFNGNAYSVEYPTNNWISISEAEMQKRKLAPYVYTRHTMVSRKNLYSICTLVLALAVGWLGYLVSGFCYDRREQPNGSI